MNISLRPELEKFVQEKVQAGEYASPEEVLEAGLDRLMVDEMDEETKRAIDEGEEQLDRGEGIPLDEAFAILRKKHLGEIQNSDARDIPRTVSPTRLGYAPI